MALDEQTRKVIQDENDKKALRLDTKQHCLKILQGIGKFDENTAHRAIWELVQNARDLANSSENGSKCVRIRIELSDDELLFAHDGKHFNYDSLSSLIKQVSSEEKEDPDAAGQFGTGFMTTHKFSRILYINSSYEVQSGTYVPLDRFKIDRSANELSPMRDAMTEQLMNVKKLLEKETTTVKIDWTEFVYTIDTEERKEAAQQGIDTVMELMPYVMTINERIVECCITDNQGNRTLFKKETRPDEEGLHVMRIWKNEIPTDCYYLQSADKKDIVILPLRIATEAMKINKVPRIFIFFPLLGTEINRINYIYHSERFYPTEPRDLIVLPDGNSEHQTKVDDDVKVLSEMSTMLFTYLKEHASKIKNSINLAPIGFDMVLRKDKTMEFFALRHKQWVEVFKNLPLIEIGEEHVSIEQIDKVRVLDHTIVDFLRQEGSDKYLDVVYEYASRVSVLPRKEEVLNWSDIVYQWDPEESKWFITIEEIVGKITSMSDKNELKEFLSYLKASGQSDYFKTKSIIPNREGELRTFAKLRNGKDFLANLYAVCKPLVPDFTSMLVDEEFASLDEFIASTRDDLKSALSSYVDNQEQSNEPYKDRLNDVLRFCLTFPTENPENNDRYKAMNVICSHYTNVPFVKNYVPHLGEVDKEQLIYKVLFDSLVKYEFKRIETEATSGSDWLKCEVNSKYLFELLSSLSNAERQTSYQTKIMPDYAIFPNQSGKLCKAIDLYVLEQDTLHSFTIADIESLRSYCLDVTGIDKRDSWVDVKYASFQTYTPEKTKTIANSIDEELKAKDYVPNVTIEIINHLDKKEPIWLYWFSSINDNKAHIFLDRIKGTKHRANVYALMKADENKLEKLAVLANNDQMDRIIDAGMKVIAQEEYQKRHDCFIRDLGLFVESILLEKLKEKIDDQSLHVEVCDNQGGQDYKIKLGEEVVYYVEVKSRWTTSDVVEMSPLQFKTSVENKACYSLCFVDMTWKNIDDVCKREYGDIQTCIKHTKILHDIGERNQWCIESVQPSKKRPHIGGSYSLTVPQDLFKPENTPTFNDLVSRIENVISDKQNVKGKL